MDKTTGQAAEQTVKPITVADLATLCRAAGKNVAVLIAAEDATNTFQFVTWGKTASDKLKARELCDWCQEAIYEGDVPKPLVVHESFVRDAALNKERLDRCVAALLQVLQTYGDSTPVQMSATKQHQCIDAYQFATGTGAYLPDGTIRPRS